MAGHLVGLSEEFDVSCRLTLMIYAALADRRLDVEKSCDTTDAGTALPNKNPCA